ncbi:alkaline serine protease [Colwellia sp. 75C3]|uniref:S8 family serine peptidase n=1 Tax=Colwellia sp. 75C3 TaxID=888425 RepID=UPI000C340689|nr:S8 family serine peptidase [Colwellia sp. 75C3]PKG83159.1 alkaline serine protease [Colwellia sp. 75C3]
MSLLKFTASALTVAVLSSVSANSMAERFIIQVDNNNKGVVKALAKKLGGDVHLDAHGFIAASFAGKDLTQVKGLLSNPHIKLIEVDQKRHLMSLPYNDVLSTEVGSSQITPYAVYQSQADQLSFDPGIGIKVCIIDSGIGRNTDDEGEYHPDFNWANISGTNDSGTGDWFEHGGPHGTHVAGTVAAKNNGVGVVGMAPGVYLHIVKVFNESGWGYSSDLAKAANDCSGADIISMSLGGGGTNSTEENAFKNFTDAGGLVLAAAGNDSNNVRSYPAGYSSVMMIGANDADNNIANFSQYPSCDITTGRGKNRKTVSDETRCVEVTAGGVNTLSTYPEGLARTASLTATSGSDTQSIYYASSVMENSGTANAETYPMGTAGTTDEGASGKICLIDRGDNISFQTKVLNCESSGGLGAIIINNVEGMLYGTLGSPNGTSIPAVGAALADRTALNASSSAAVSITSSDYGYMSGTSMATPAVAGVAALVWSHNTGCTGIDIRNALKATAQDGGVSGKDVHFGYGIVQAKAASEYLTAEGCGIITDPEPIDDITLTASFKGKKVNLSWSGLAGTVVDIFRNGINISTTANDGSYNDRINENVNSYTYQVCEEGTEVCSEFVTVDF